MRRLSEMEMMKSFIGSLLFSVIVPGTFFLLLPYTIAQGYGDFLAFDAGWLRFMGIFLAGIGIAGYLWAAGAFVLTGKGTPAPSLPPTQFVATGPYRYVRNPQYLSGMLVLTGEALYYQTGLLLIYAAFLFTAFHTFVALYEEPTLIHRFGEPYQHYLLRVSRWLPIRQAAQVLLLLNTVIWLAFGIASLERGSATSQISPLAATVIALMMFGNAGAMLVCAWLVGRRLQRFYFFAYAVLFVNILLTITDQVGIYEVITLLLDLIVLGLLVAVHRRDRAEKRPTAGSVGR